MRFVLPAYFIDTLSSYFSTFKNFVKLFFDLFCQNIVEIVRQLPPLIIALFAGELLRNRGGNRVVKTAFSST